MSEAGGGAGQARTSAGGTFRTCDSPVRAAVSTANTSPDAHAQSAGTMSPPRSSTTSPGTSSGAGRDTMAPSRRTRTFPTIADLRACTDDRALYSSANPMAPLTTRSVTMMERSSLRVG